MASVSSSTGSSMLGQTAFLHVAVWNKRKYKKKKAVFDVIINKFMNLNIKKKKIMNWTRRSDISNVHLFGSNQLNPS